jgi:hypothetical protein
VNLLIAILALLLLAAVILVVSAPLRDARRERDASSPERGELEAAREAKYREIRDAELDYRTGKLSREDYEALDGALRVEALEILNRLQESAAGDPRPDAGDPRPETKPREP